MDQAERRIIVNIFFDTCVIALAIAAMWRILCISKDADLATWEGTRHRFMLLVAPYALTFVAMAAFLGKQPCADKLLLLSVVSMLFSFRNPFTR